MRELVEEPFEEPFEDPLVVPLDVEAALGDPVAAVFGSTDMVSRGSSLQL